MPGHRLEAGVDAALFAMADALSTAVFMLS